MYLVRLYFRESYSIKITLRRILFFLGLFPDVGGGYALSRVKGKLGIFLALTGEGKFCCCNNIIYNIYLVTALLRCKCNFIFCQHLHLSGSGYNVLYSRWFVFN